jgi:hypothetical protein
LDPSGFPRTLAVAIPKIITVPIPITARTVETPTRDSCWQGRADELG